MPDPCRNDQRLQLLRREDVVQSVAAGDEPVGLPGLKELRILQRARRLCSLKQVLLEQRHFFSGVLPVEGDDISQGSHMLSSQRTRAIRGRPWRSAA
jgi:hypothetical protein